MQGHISLENTSVSAAYHPNILLQAVSESTKAFSWAPACSSELHKSIILRGYLVTMMMIAPTVVPTALGQLSDPKFDPKCALLRPEPRNGQGWLVYSAERMTDL